MLLLNGLTNMHNNWPIQPNKSLSATMSMVGSHGFTPKQYQVARQRAQAIKDQLKAMEWESEMEMERRTR